jgi:hypothetical protein
MSMKIRPVGADLFRVGGRADGQTERQTVMTKLTVTYGNFADTPKIFKRQFFSLIYL